MTRKKQPSRDFLDGTTRKPKRRRFCTFDIESKCCGEASCELCQGNPRAPGFVRPFLVGFYDPDARPRKGEKPYVEFRDEPHLLARPWKTRHLQPGGCIDKLLNYLLTPRFAGRVVYSHNGGKFDELFLLAWLEQHRDEFDFEVIPIQSTIQMIRVWRLPEDPEADTSKLETWEFLDSIRLCPMSLAEACRTFGLKEEESKIAFDLGSPEEDPRWSVYLERDCVSLAKVMFKVHDLVENRLGGEVGITLPSSAMKLFRRQFIGRHGVPERLPRYRHWDDCKDRETCPGCAHEWIRRGYFGGRTEIFRHRGSGLKYYDVRSSYVAAMREDMPIGERIVEHGRIDWRKHRSDANPTGRYTGFAECSIYIPPECPIPPLPSRSKKTGKLVFENGYLSGVWSIDELALLSDPLVGGRIISVRRVVWFQLLPCFGHMVDVLWEFRNPVCEACRASGFSEERCPHFDEGLSALAKLLGNSTYGKFAMKEVRTSVVFARGKKPESCFVCGQTAGDGVQLCPDCYGSKPATNDPEGLVWYQRKQVDAPYIIPQISSHITALGRIRLWRAMREALTTRAGDETASRVERGAVLMLPAEGEPRALAEGEACRQAIVVQNASSGGGLVTLRRLDDARVERFRIAARTKLTIGGFVYYTDTDSCVCNVQLKTAGHLGALKDEYPNETLTYLGIQAKVYMIQPERLNADIRRRRSVLLDEDADPSTLDRANASQGEFYAKAKAYPVKELSKVTMKGFPRHLRTKENLEKLQAGSTIEWQQLEQVRTLAREGFKRPPLMSKRSKSFRSAYDKRAALEGHPEGATEAHFRDIDMEEAAE